MSISAAKVSTYRVMCATLGGSLASLGFVPELTAVVYYNASHGTLGCYYCNGHSYDFFEPQKYKVY